jgi:hypothetical protein
VPVLRRFWPRPAADRTRATYCAAKLQLRKAPHTICCPCPVLVQPNSGYAQMCLSACCASVVAFLRCGAASVVFILYMLTLKKLWSGKALALPACHAGGCASPFRAHFCSMPYGKNSDTGHAEPCCLSLFASASCLNNKKALPWCKHDRFYDLFVGAW